MREAATSGPGGPGSPAGPARRARRLRGDDGTYLMLMPAGVLVVLVLGAIAADLSHVRMARSDLFDLADAMANDIATAAIDRDVFRTTGRVEISPTRARAIAEDLRRSRQGRSLRDITYVSGGGSAVYAEEDRPDGTRHLVVRLRARVDYIFARAIPGAGDSMPIEAVSDMTLEDE